MFTCGKLIRVLKFEVNTDGKSLLKISSSQFAQFGRLALEVLFAKPPFLGTFTKVLVITKF